jgi:sulfur dioxygenase
MLFRQLVHHQSSTFTYLIGSRPGGKGLIIDPVAEHLDLYLRLIEAFELKLELALDTHFHTDHVSALGALRDRTQCITARGTVVARGPDSRPSAIRPLEDGEVLQLDELEIEVMYTPGHTPDSYSFVMDDRVFTGDTLLIRSTGRTDQGGDPRAQYESLSKLLGLPGRTLVYPGHDYHGRHVSTIADERRHNPRLQLETIDEYVALMQSVRPASADQMDVVESASLRPSGVLLRQLAGVRAALETWGGGPSDSVSGSAAGGALGGASASSADGAADAVLNGRKARA